MWQMAWKRARPKQILLVRAAAQSGLSCPVDGDTTAGGSAGHALTPTGATKLRLAAEAFGDEFRQTSAGAWPIAPGRGKLQKLSAALLQACGRGTL
jgi:hypothetical protein